MKRTPILRKSAPKKTNPARRKRETSSLPWKRAMKAERLRRKREKEAREYARKYGSEERVKFVKSLPCAACGVVGYSENAHLLGNGGMGRKAGYETIGPLCGIHVERRPLPYPRWEVVSGCHFMYDELRERFDAHFPNFDAEQIARETEKLWWKARREIDQFRKKPGSSPGGKGK